MLRDRTTLPIEKQKSKEMIAQKNEISTNNKNKENDSAVQQAKIDEVLNELNWEAAGDSAALEKRLHDEIVALETVIIFKFFETLSHCRQTILRRIFTRSSKVRKLQRKLWNKLNPHYYNWTK